MANGPSTTLTQSHTIGSPRLWPAVNFNINSTDPAPFALSGSFFSYSRAGSPIIAFALNNSNNYCINFQNVNYGTSGKQFNSYGVSFLHDGTSLEIAIRANASNVALLCKVDDAYITINPINAGLAPGNEYFYYLNFGTQKMRRIDFYGDQSSYFGGVYTAQIDTICPAPLRGPRCIVVGDSFLDFNVSGTQSPVNNLVQWFAESMGWDDVWSSGVGASGYIAGGSGNPTVGTRILGDVIAYNPDVVIFTSGFDDSTSTPSAVGAAAAAVFQHVRAALPNAVLMASSATMNRGIENVTVNEVNIAAAIKAAILTVGGYWLDFYHLPLLNGITPMTTTLQASVSAGTTTIPVNDYPPLEGSFAFPDGTGFKNKAVSLPVGSPSVPPYTITSAGPIQGSWPMGTVLTQVGDAYLTGTGNSGSLSGYGNCDRYVYTDGTHPSQIGAIATGQVLALLVKHAIDPQ